MFHHREFAILLRDERPLSPRQVVRGHQIVDFKGVTKSALVVECILCTYSKATSRPLSLAVFSVMHFGAALAMTMASFFFRPCLTISRAHVMAPTMAPSGNLSADFLTCCMSASSPFQKSLLYKAK